MAQPNPNHTSLSPQSASTETPSRAGFHARYTPPPRKAFPFLLNQAEHQALIVLADATGSSMSSVLRRLVLREYAATQARVHKDQHGQPTHKKGT